VGFCSTKVEFDRDSATEKQLIDTVDHAKVRDALLWPFFVIEERQIHMPYTQVLKLNNEVRFKSCALVVPLL